MLRFKLDKTLLAILLVYVLILVFAVGNPPHTDETTHSLVGLFMRDLARDLLANPTLSFNKIYNYALSYSTYYPHLSLHYPPLPQMFFATAYSLFGASLIVSRLVILAMSAVMAMLIYYFAFNVFKDKRVAIIAALVVATSPIVVSLSVLAMQEIPFILFFTLVMMWFYRIKESTVIKNYLILSLLIVLAILSKWQAITILPVMLIYVLLFNKKVLKHILLSFIISGLILLPYYFVLWKAGILLLPFAANLEAEATDPTWMQLEGWTYYLNAIVLDQFFLPVGILVLGSTIFYLYNRNKDWQFFATWILVVYLIMVVIHNKDARYTVNILPAFAIPAAYIIYNYGRKFVNQSIFYIIISVLIISQFVLSVINIPIGFIDVDGITDAIVGDGKGNVILSANLGIDTPFIFELAERGNFNQQFFRPCMIEFYNVSSEEIINKFGIKYIILEKELPRVAKKRIEFRDYILNNKNFSLVREFDKFVLLKNDVYVEKEKVKLCNFICSTRELVCSNIKMPSDALK